MNKRFQSLISLFLAGTLLVNACPGLEAAHFLPTPVSVHQRQFLINQEKMRLESEALASHAISTAPGSQLMLSRETFPFFSRIPFASRFLVRFKNPASDQVQRTPEQQKQVARVEERLKRLLPPLPELITAGVIVSIGMLFLNALGMMPFTGVSLACGDAIIIALAKAWPMRRLQNMGDRVIALIDYRGRQAGGWVTYFANGNSVRGRVKNPKRGDLAKNMARMFQVVFAITAVVTMLCGGTLSPMIRILHGHVRQATASLSTQREAHPHQWLGGRLRKVWVVINGTPIQVLKYVRNTISHNGDFDDIHAVWHKLTHEEQEAIERTPHIMLFGKPMSQSEAGQWLNKVFGTRNALKGDSPKIAGFIDLFHTQGQPEAAIRLVAATRLAQSSDEDLLPDSSIKALAKIFNQVLESSGPLLPPHARRLSEMTPETRKRLQQVFAAELIKEGWSEPLGGGTDRFARQAIRAFADNDLLAATHEFMKRAIGTFGLAVSSSMAEDRFVVSARKQPMSLGFSEDGTIAGAFSAQSAPKLRPYDQRIDLDLRGETAEVGMDPEKGVFINLFPEPFLGDRAELDAPVVQVPQETIWRDRLIPLKDNSLVEPLREDYGENTVRTDLEEVPAVGQRITRAWDRGVKRDVDDYEGFPLQTAAALSPLYQALAIEKAVLPYIPIRNQTPAFQDWLAPLTLQLAEQALSGQLGSEELEQETKQLIQASLEWAAAHANETADEAEMDRPIDVLLYGFENPLWAVEQGLNDLELVHGKKRLLNIRTTSANKVLAAMRVQEKNPSRRYRIPGVGIVGPQTIFIPNTQSGETSPVLGATIQVADKVYMNDQLELPENHRIFSIVGELDTPIASILGQRFTLRSKFVPRFFLNLSGRRPAEPSSVAAIAGHLTITEILNYLWEDYRRIFKGDLDPLGLKLSAEEVQSLKDGQAALVLKDFPELAGINAEGTPIRSEVYQRLNHQALRIAMRVWDSSLKALVSGFYVIATVRYHMPTVGHWPQLLGRYLIEQGWPQLGTFFSGLLMGDALLWVDALTYLSVTGIVFVWLFRWATQRPVFTRISNPKIFLTDVPHVYQPAVMNLSKLLALSLAWFNVTVHGGSSRDHFLARYSHRAVRGDEMIMGLPDEQLPALAGDTNESLLTGTQMFGNVSMGNTIRTISIGRGKKKAGVFEEHIRLPDRPNGPGRPMPENMVVQRLFESRFDAAARMLSSFVLNYLWVHKVTLGGRLWDYTRTQGGARTFTTAVPVSAAKSWLWEPLERQGWISKTWADRLAFLESFIFTGLMMSLPLSFFSPEAADPYRFAILAVGAFIFGFFGHKKSLTEKIIYGFMFNIGFLRPGSSPMENMWIALGFHFLVNNVLLLLLNKLLYIKPTSEPNQVILGTSRVPSRYEIRPGVIIPASFSPGLQVVEKLGDEAERKDIQTWMERILTEPLKVDLSRDVRVLDRLPQTPHRVWEAVMTTTQHLRAIIHPGESELHIVRNGEWLLHYEAISNTFKLDADLFALVMMGDPAALELLKLTAVGEALRYQNARARRPLNARAEAEAIQQDQVRYFVMNVPAEHQKPLIRLLSNRANLQEEALAKALEAAGSDVLPSAEPPPHPVSVLPASPAKQEERVQPAVPEVESTRGFFRWRAVAAAAALGFMLIQPSGSGPSARQALPVSNAAPAPLTAPTLNRSLDVRALSPLPGETLSAQDRKLPSEEQETLALQRFEQFVIRLRGYREFEASLQGPTQGAGGSMQKVWLVIRDQFPAGTEADFTNISPSHTYDLSSLASSKPQRSWYDWLKGLFSLLLVAGVSVVSTSGAYASTLTTTVSSSMQHAGLVAVKTAVHHTVRSGDTLEFLSKIYNTTPEAFKAQNSRIIFNINDIYTGDKLVVPGLEKTLYELPQFQAPDMGPLITPDLHLGLLDHAYALFHHAVQTAGEFSPVLLGIALAVIAIAGIMALRRAAPLVRVPVFARALIVLLAALQPLPAGAWSALQSLRVPADARVLYPFAGIEATLFNYALAKKNLDDLKALEKANPALSDLKEQIQTAESRLAEAIAAGERLSIPIDADSMDILGLSDVLVRRQWTRPASDLLEGYISEINTLLHASKKMGKKDVLRKVTRLEDVRRQMVEQWSKDLQELAAHHRRAESARADAAANPTPASLLHYNALYFEEMVLMSRLRAAFPQADLDRMVSAEASQAADLAGELAASRAAQVIPGQVNPIAEKAATFAGRTDKKERKEELTAASDALKDLVNKKAGVESARQTTAVPGSKTEEAAADPAEAAPVVTEQPVPVEESEIPLVPAEKTEPAAAPTPVPSTRVGRAVEQMRQTRARAEEAHTRSAVVDEVVANYQLSDLKGLKGNTFWAVVAGKPRVMFATPPYWAPIKQSAKWLVDPLPSEDKVRAALPEGALLNGEYQLLQAMDLVAATDSKEDAAIVAEFVNLAENPPAGLEPLAARLKQVLASPDEARSTLPARMRAYQDSLKVGAQDKPVGLFTFEWPASFTAPSAPVAPAEVKATPAPAPLTRVGRVVERIREARERAVNAHARSSVLEEVVGNYEMSNLSGLQGNTLWRVVSGRPEEMAATPPYIAPVKWFAEWLKDPLSSEDKVRAALPEGALLNAEYELLKTMDRAAATKSDEDKALLAGFVDLAQNPPEGLEPLAARLNEVMNFPDTARATLAERMRAYQDSLRAGAQKKPVGLFTFEWPSLVDSDPIAGLQVLDRASTAALLTEPKIPPLLEANAPLDVPVDGPSALATASNVGEVRSPQFARPAEGRSSVRSNRSSARPATPRPAVRRAAPRTPPRTAKPAPKTPAQAAPAPTKPPAGNPRDYLPPGRATPQKPAAAPTARPDTTNKETGNVRDWLKPGRSSTEKPPATPVKPETTNKETGNVREWMPPGSAKFFSLGLGGLALDPGSLLHWFSIALMTAGVISMAIAAWNLLAKPKTDAWQKRLLGRSA